MALFKVMTWNIENLFQVGSESGPNTDEEYQQKLQSLASAVLQLAPDVLGLQEIGSPEALDDLLSLLENRYPYVRLSGHPDSRGIRVGFLSKFEIKDHEDIIDFPPEGLPSVPGIDSKGKPIDVKQFGRGALRIVVEPTDGLTLNIINTHLKSKLLTFPNATGRPRFNTDNEDERARVAGIALLKRTAEAIALRVLANNRVVGGDRQALILLGDLNDGVSAATTQILNGPGGSEIGTGGFNRKDKGDDARLFNLAALIPEERRYSRINQGNKELIDHILVSEELLPGEPRVLPTVDSHVAIFGSLPSVAIDPGLRRGKPASDHAPGTAIFEF